MKDRLRLDHSHLLGFKLTADAQQKLSDPRIGAKIGPKIDPRMGAKVGGPKIDPRLGAKVGPKIDPRTGAKIGPKVSR